MQLQRQTVNVSYMSNLLFSKVYQTMYVRRYKPEDVLPERLADLMQNFVSSDGRTGLSQIALARLMYERRYGEESQSSINTRYAEKRDLECKAIARRISHFLKGDYFPKWSDLVELADFFGKPIGYLIGETDCDSYELQDVADIVGLEGEAVTALKSITRRMSVEWLPEKSTPEGKRPSADSVFIAQDMVEKVNAEPDACRAVLNRMITSKTFKDLLISLSNVGESEYELLMTRLNVEVKRLQQEDDTESIDELAMQQMARKAQARDAGLSLKEAEDALKACRYEAYEFYVRLVDEMFSDMSNTDITAKAKLIAKKP